MYYITRPTSFLEAITARARLGQALRARQVYQVQRALRVSHHIIYTPYHIIYTPDYMPASYIYTPYHLHIYVDSTSIYIYIVQYHRYIPMYVYITCTDVHTQIHVLSNTHHIYAHTCAAMPVCVCVLMRARTVCVCVCGRARMR